MKRLLRAMSEDSGQATVEYALIMGLVVVVWVVLALGMVDRIDPAVEGFIDQLVFRIKSGTIPQHIIGALTHF
jgi:Flp pilus assembly pilin Flp